jgi:hypothetical protein
MKKINLILTAVLIALASDAVVQVDFSHSYTGPGAVTQNTGDITLLFNVDGSGNVVLDASCANTNPATYVNEFDGSVGTVSNLNLWGSSFSIILSGTGPLRIDKGGFGLCIQGGNAQRLDFSNEGINATEAITDGTLILVAANYANATTSAGTLLDVSGVSYALSGASGSISVSAEDSFSITSASDADGQGFVLSGFTFDVVEIVVEPDIAELVPDAGVSAGSYTVESFDGRTVWVPDNTATQLFFQVPGSFNFVSGYPVYARIEYHDSGQGRLFAEYDSPINTYEDAEVHARSSRDGGDGFVYSYQLFENPQFNGGQAGATDFRFKLLGTDGTPLRIAGAQISTTPYQDERFVYALSKPWLEPYAGPSKDFISAKSVKGKVMAGYQGWFATPNDYDDLGWRHWSRNSNIAPSPTEITVDMWPYLDDYSAADIEQAGQMVYQDGRPAYLFSTRDPDVVQRHFRWMRKHNVDGVYLQRFVSKNSGGANGKPEFVLDNVRKAANLEGRVWAIEYDVSGLDGGNPEGSDIALQLDIITNDWNYLVNECGILDDPRYLHEDGKPVLFIWGFGTGNNISTAAQADSVISWFDAQNLYLIGGVSKGKIDEAAWEPVLRKYDALLEWMEQSRTELVNQKNKLDGFGMDILPHAWPGFSWNNLQQTVFPASYTARNGGDFYWDRIYNAVNSGADQIFLGMFDEYDEGTAIMPMSDTHPDIHTAWGHYLDNEGLDPFWYLRLSGAGREMLNGLRSLNGATPSAGSLTPVAYGGDDTSAYLGTNNIANGLVHAIPPDGLTDGTFIAGHDCRTNAAGKIYFYFDIEDSLVFQNTEGQEATIEVEFYDNYPGTRLRLQYDSLTAIFTQHPNVVNPADSGGWKTIRWNVSDGYFGNRQNGGSDFRIGTFSGEIAAIRRVSVFYPEETGGSAADSPTVDTSNGLMEWPVTSDATGWRLAENNNLSSNVWTEVLGPFAITNGMMQYEAAATNQANFYRLERPARK